MRPEGNAPDKRRNSNWFLLHDNTPAHQPVLVKDLFAKNDVTTLDHSPYPPDLAPADFYLLIAVRIEETALLKCY